MKLEEIGEFGLIEKIRKSMPLPCKPVIVGIGDDAAAVMPEKGSLVLITSDMFLEGIHFDRSFSDPFHIGFKALAVNISDVAAMGGKPTAAIISIGLPQDITVEEVEGLFDGIKESSREFGISVAGGDTCRSVSGLILSITLLGEVEEDLMVLRSNAKVGDAIFVTGILGDSAAGLELLRKSSQFTSHSSRSLIERHLMPHPKIDEGRMIAENKWATAMIDISDGLLSDLSHICDESGTGAEIYLERVPLSSELREVAEEMKRDPLSLALKGGEDYELLFTSPKDKAEEVMNARIKGKPLAAMIGEVIKGERVLIDESGKRHPFVPEGYDHFRRR